MLPHVPLSGVPEVAAAGVFSGEEKKILVTPQLLLETNLQKQIQSNSAFTIPMLF